MGLSIAPSRRHAVLIGTACLAILTFWYFWHGRSARQVWQGTLNAAEYPLTDSRDIPCKAQPGGSDVAVLVKTGVAAARQQVLTQLRTTLRCTPDFAIYSDAPDAFHSVEIHDALAALPEHVTAAQPEFAAWHAVHDRIWLGEPHTDGLLDAGDAARLERWMALPLLRAAAANPTARWFLVVDAATHVVFSNLQLWLARLDPAEKHFFGAPAVDGKSAAGGAGIALSRPAVAAAVAALDAEEETWLARAAAANSSAHLMTQMLESTGTPLHVAEPLLSSTPFAAQPFTAESWCRPAVSLPSLSPRMREAMWEAEQTHLRLSGLTTATAQREPLLHRDVFAALVAPVVLTSVHGHGHDDDGHADDGGSDVERKGWDNLPLANEEPAVDAADAAACRAACTADAECMQWRFEDGKCRLAQTVRLGEEAGEGRTVVSGWIGGRVEVFVRGMQPCAPRWDGAGI